MRSRMGRLLPGRFHHVVRERLGLDQLEPGQHVIVLRRRVLLHRKAKRKKKVLPWQVVAQNLVQPNPIEGDCTRDRKSTRLNSSHGYISYAVFCLKKKKKQ